MIRAFFLPTHAAHIVLSKMWEKRENQESRESGDAEPGPATRGGAPGSRAFGVSLSWVLYG